MKPVLAVLAVLAHAPWSRESVTMSSESGWISNEMSRALLSTERGAIELLDDGRIAVRGLSDAAMSAMRELCVEHRAEVVALLDRRCSRCAARPRRWGALITPADERVPSPLCWDCLTVVARQLYPEG